MLFSTVLARTLAPLALRACPITATVCLPPSPTQAYEHIAIAVGAALAVGVGIAILIKRKIRLEEPVGKTAKVKERSRRAQ